MVDHYLQKRIISDLVEHEASRYADLKPAHIEGNVFTYHLRSLIKQKLITKNDDGTYCLTSEGKLYGINGSVKAHELLAQAHAIILLSIRDGHGRWLLRKRLVQPMFGKTGFIHGEPQAGETVEAAAARILQRRTGLTGDMNVKGSGYICLEEGGELIAYSAFTLLEVTVLRGDLITADAHGENTWHQEPDFNSKEMIPSMADLAEELEKPGLFFLDKTYGVD